MESSSGLNGSYFYFLSNLILSSDNSRSSNENKMSCSICLRIETFAVIITVHLRLIVRNEIDRSMFVLVAQEQRKGSNWPVGVMSGNKQTSHHDHDHHHRASERDDRRTCTVKKRPIGRHGEREREKEGKDQTSNSQSSRPPLFRSDFSCKKNMLLGIVVDVTALITYSSSSNNKNKR